MGFVDEAITGGWEGIVVNELGVLTGLPPEGLDVIEGVAVELRAGFAEWFGLGFTTASGDFECVATGSRPDWIDRPLLSSALHYRTEEAAYSVSQVGS